MDMRHAAVVAGLALGLMSGAAHAATIGYSGAFTTYDVTQSGVYVIFAYGAQGGSASGGLGGLGAEIEGSFDLISGEVLNIAVGGQGASTNSSFNGYGGGGGGGGTFVTLSGSAGRSSDTALVIAGGGGGGSSSENGGPGLAGPDGGSSSSIGNGGTGGSAGTGGSGANSQGGGGGGGLLTNGTKAQSFSANRGAPGGISYLNGLDGGAGNGSVVGGFGGGGAGSGQTYGAGGGGGYSGGGGGASNASGGTAGGGGSYFNNAFAGSLSGVMLSGVNSGNGSVTIDFVSALPSVVPLPASATMFGAALLGLAGLAYAAKRKKAARSLISGTLARHARGLRCGRFA